MAMQADAPRSDRRMGLVQDVGAHRHTCSEGTCHAIEARKSCTDLRHACTRSRDKPEGRSHGTHRCQFLDIHRGAPAAQSRCTPGIRPISLWRTSCKSFSRTLRDVGTHRTGRADPAMQGYRKSFQCAELIQTLRCLTQKATLCQILKCVSQIEFTRSYDSVRLGAIQRSTLWPRVPAPGVATHLRDMRGSELCFTQDGWRKNTSPEHRAQGYSMSPLVFRWIMEDAIDSVRTEWQP